MVKGRLSLGTGNWDKACAFDSAWFGFAQFNYTNMHRNVECEMQIDAFVASMFDTVNG